MTIFCFVVGKNRIENKNNYNGEVIWEHLFIILLDH
ncbi:hypothetical protein AHYW_001206 [Providencia manganoxydans]